MQVVSLMTIVMVSLSVMASSVTSTTAAECPRVRKNWSVLTPHDKKLFLGALGSAMDSGMYMRFIEMHTEMMSELEAHEQCMFVYWHRMFLLVFENMLRAQGPQYACVTIPYWDWITDHSRFLAGQCRTMAGCSSVLNELGGVPSGMQESMTSIHGESITGFCVNANPLDHFCESPSHCMRCVPRGNWNTAAPPGAASYASVMSQIFTATSIGEFSPQIEQGVHDSIHQTLDGAMATLRSPSDPMFYLHHSMIDLLQVVFHKCRIGTALLTFQQKATNLVTWRSCGRRNNTGYFKPTDVITMRTGGGVSGRPVIPGPQDPLVGRFFQGVPMRFADVVDTRDLGYSYELAGITATMYAQCGNTLTTTAAVSSPQRVSVSSPVGARRSLRTTKSETSGRSAEVKAPDVDTAVIVRSLDPVQQVSRSPVSINAVTIVDPDTNAAIHKVFEWYNTMVQATGGPSKQSLEQIERMMCIYQDECLGGVADFTPHFKTTWGVLTARCKRIVDKIRVGKLWIAVTNWKPYMIQCFGCPIPQSS